MPARSSRKNTSKKWTFYWFSLILPLPECTVAPQTMCCLSEEWTSFHGMVHHHFLQKKRLILRVIITQARRCGDFPELVVKCCEITEGYPSIVDPHSNIVVAGTTRATTCNDDAKTSTQGTLTKRWNCAKSMCLDWPQLKKLRCRRSQIANYLLENALKIHYGENFAKLTWKHFSFNFGTPIKMDLERWTCHDFKQVLTSPTWWYHPCHNVCCKIGLV